MMFYTNHFFGMDIIWWFIWVVILVWIFLVPYDIPGQRNKKERPLDILQKRFARGAIDLKEYQRNKAVLENDAVH
ncbi:SHOCT domain-containing protein [Pedobacter psychroterrae]|uniref:SHOCT domain-containing protein n=2 Tax=Pedobacter psychroterrae TaxID=2530453 RepID=A0A4R0NL35_9SPHI|nr:SHOCT domain-containing protein [Pedobacter psychroterrae]